MVLSNISLACCATLLSLLSASVLAKTAERCEPPKAGAKEAPIFSPPVFDVVTGEGRLQFYSAPSFRCAMDGVFVVPKDELVEYARTDDGWSSVIYFSSKGDAEGWVRSGRLKIIGAVAPKQ